MHWGLGTDRETLYTVLEFNTISAGTSGYIAYGISSSGTMLGSEVVVSGKDVGYELTAHSVEGVSVSNSNWHISTDTTTQNGVISLKQVRSIYQGIDKLRNISFIMAYHSISTTLTHHTNTATFYVDVNEGSIGPIPTPAPTFDRNCLSSTLLSPELSPYTCRRTFNVGGGSGNMHWKLHNDLKTISVAVQAPTDVVRGYSCFGVSSSQGMINTSAVCVDPGSVTPSEYFLVARSVAGVLSGVQNQFSSKSVSVEGGIRTIHFIKELSAEEQVHLYNKNLAFVFAGHSSAVHLTHHDIKSVLVVDIFESVESGPRITPAPTFARRCEPSSKAGYNCVRVLHPTQSYEIGIHYSLSSDRLSGRLALEYNPQVSAGYFAIGFSNCSCMVGSSIVAALTQSGSISTHLLVERSVMGIGVSPLVESNIFNKRFTREATSAFLEFEFVIPKDHFYGTHPFGGSFTFGLDNDNKETLSVNMVYAYHTTANTITHHWGNRGSFDLDLQDAIDGQLELTPVPTVTYSCNRSQLTGSVWSYPCVSETIDAGGPVVKIHYGASSSFSYVKVALEVDFSNSVDVGFSAFGISESATPCECMLGNEAVVGSTEKIPSYYQLTGHYVLEVLERSIADVSFENATYTTNGAVSILEAIWKVRDTHRTASLLRSYPIVFAVHDSSPHLTHHTGSGVVNIDILDSVDLGFNPTFEEISELPTPSPTEAGKLSECEYQSSEIGYHCVHQLSSKYNVLLHWKVVFIGTGEAATPVKLSVLITASISGWLALSFPTTPASMYPSVGVLSFDDGLSGTNGLFLINGRSSSDIQVTGDPLFSLITTERVSEGVRLSFDYELVQTSLPLNWALHASDPAFPSAKHDRRGAVTLDITTGEVSKLSIRPDDIVEAHSYLGCLVWFLLVPIAITGKRHAAQLGFAFGYSVGHSAHNLGMILVTILTSVVYAWCTNFTTPTKYFHAHTGLALLGLTWFQIALTLLKPSAMSDWRRLWNTIHRSGSLILAIIAIVCCATGVANQALIFYDEPYFQYILVMILPLALAIAILLKLEIKARDRRNAYRVNKQRHEREMSEAEIQPPPTPPRPFTFPIREVEVVNTPPSFVLPGTIVSPAASS
eukprot:TRINITY_DN5084_c5_g1_i2.p1 TRINITY_DN5084_c5_g1~~TRINITY_DN5084_c5_g1_i2.p1  ORF type:complete len:1113 (+),score=209.70 TRINITY_DN5084_c5_g1_i2:657-3995(+)